MMWLAKNKGKTCNEWRWLLKEYKECYVQSSPTQSPDINDWHLNSYIIPTVIQQPAETIRSQFKEPTAVVLQEKELLKLLDEFVELVWN